MHNRHQRHRLKHCPHPAPVPAADDQGEAAIRQYREWRARLFPDVEPEQPRPDVLDYLITEQAS